MAYHPWHDVELPTNLDEPVPAIIEIPMGSKVKYELDKKSGLLKVDRILFSAVHYPANYGFIPRTYCGDGDPLDVLVYCQEPIASMAEMRAKVIGVMKMRDDKGEDDKLIAVHADDPAFQTYSDLWQLPPHRLRELKRFFEDYKALEHKTVVVQDPMGRDEALKVLRDAIRYYNENREALIAGHEIQPPSEPHVDLEVMPSVPEEKPRRTRRKKAEVVPPAVKAPRSRAARKVEAPAARGGRGRKRS